MEAGGFIDVAQNPNLLMLDGEHHRVAVGGTELFRTDPDIVAPFVVEARLFLNGVVPGMLSVLQIYLSETLRSSLLFHE